MQGDSFRFQPPSVEIPTAVRWALGRAFAGPDWRPPTKVDPQAALSWATLLGVEARIAFRSSPEELARELQGDAAQQLFRSRHQSVARGMQIQDLLERVAICRAELSLPLVALKGVALLESGVTAPGARTIGNVEVLVPAGQAKRLARRLLEEGLQASVKTSGHFQMPPLSHPTLGMLQISHEIPGLSAHGSGNATADDLIRCGLCQESPRLGGVKLPTNKVMAAHAVTHALAQHAKTPREYPPTRILGDLFDLAADEGEEIGSFLLSCGRYIRRSISKRELQAVADLCRHLAQGSPDALRGDSGALIRHVVAGCRDSKYRRSLGRSVFFRALVRRDWQKLKKKK
ncbi:MAG: nucleotidyltransferase family protein [Thermoanaerobaculia bacterium]